MGGFDHEASGPGTPGAPRLKVIGFSVMGGVEVRRKALKPPGQRKQDRAVERDRRGQIGE
jgi:hypothetical protein